MRSTDRRHMLSFLGKLHGIQERNEVQFAFKGRNNSWSWSWSWLCPEEPLLKAHGGDGGSTTSPRFTGLHPSSPRCCVKGGGQR